MRVIAHVAARVPKKVFKIDIRGGSQKFGSDVQHATFVERFLVLCHASDASPGDDENAGEKTYEPSVWS
jgi:hypothetical protein